MSDCLRSWWCHWTVFEEVIAVRRRVSRQGLVHVTGSKEIEREVALFDKLAPQFDGKLRVNACDS